MRDIRESKSSSKARAAQKEGVVCSLARGPGPGFNFRFSFLSASVCASPDTAYTQHACNVRKRERESHSSPSLDHWIIGSQRQRRRQREAAGERRRRE